MEKVGSWCLSLDSPQKAGSEIRILEQVVYLKANSRKHCEEGRSDRKRRQANKLCVHEQAVTMTTGAQGHGDH